MMYRALPIFVALLSCASSVHSASIFSRLRANVNDQERLGVPSGLKNNLKPHHFTWKAPGKDDGD